jgi:YD repeat-containing protein
MIDTVTHGSGSNASLEKWEADPSGMARPRRIFSTNALGTQELWSSGNYEFDGSGNIKKIGTTSYTYDPFGRLTSWTTTNGSRTLTSRRVLDAYGNELTSSSQSCGPAGGFLQCTSGASAPPRSMVATTNHYADSAHDGAGNVTNERGFRTYTWDPLGMMTSATVSGRTFRYIYTAENERIAAVERVPVSAELRNRTTFTLRGSANQLLSTWIDDWTSGPASSRGKKIRSGEARSYWPQLWGQTL